MRITVKLITPYVEILNAASDFKRFLMIMTTKNENKSITDYARYNLSLMVFYQALFDNVERVT